MQNAKKPRQYVSSDKLNSTTQLNDTLSMDELQYHYLKHVIRKKNHDGIELFNELGTWQALINLDNEQFIIQSHQPLNPHLLKNYHHINTQQSNTELNEWLEDLSLEYAHLNTETTPLNKLSKWFMKDNANQIIAYIPLLKANNTDLVIEKMTELGFKTLQLFYSDHSVVKTTNLDRLERIVKKATEQSGQFTLPTLLPPESIHKLIPTNEPYHLLFADETLPRVNLKTVTTSVFDGYLVGPEGGFSPREQALLREQSNLTPVKINDNILRAETACISCAQLVLLSRAN